MHNINITNEIAKLIIDVIKAVTFGDGARMLPCALDLVFDSGSSYDILLDIKNIPIKGTISKDDNTNLLK